MLGNSTEYGYVLSIMLHAAVIAIAWTGVPYLKRELPEESVLIIDLVQIADITAAAPRPVPEPNPDVDPEPETLKPVQADASPPSEAMPPPPEESAAPPKQTNEVPPPRVKPRPKPKPPPTKEDDIAFLNRLVKDLEKEDSAKPKSQVDGAEGQQPSNNFASTFSNTPTQSELNVIISHIEDHWRIDPGKEGVDALTVEVKIIVSADGAVQQAQIIDMPRYMMDNAFRTFANSARTAVLTASPLPINPENAEAFREMTLVFSPRGRIN
jgi:outer membrane biosynthesis protein TonB